MSIHSNGVSLKFIGIFVFLAITMNCLSWVIGAAMDNKGATDDCICWWHNDMMDESGDGKCDGGCGGLCREYISGHNVTYNSTCSQPGVYVGLPCYINVDGSMMSGNVEGCQKDANGNWYCYVDNWGKMYGCQVPYLS